MNRKHLFGGLLVVAAVTGLLWYGHGGERWLGPSLAWTLAWSALIGLHVGRVESVAKGRLVGVAGGLAAALMDGLIGYVNPGMRVISPVTSPLVASVAYGLVQDPDRPPSMSILLEGLGFGGVLGGLLGVSLAALGALVGSAGGVESLLVRVFVGGLAEGLAGAIAVSLGFYLGIWAKLVFIHCRLAGDGSRGDGRPRQAPPRASGVKPAPRDTSARS